MNEKRREIIINEIQYWKRSRLLPEQYCDFLLALYTEGEHVSEPKRFSIKNNKTYLFHLSVLIIICLLIPITFLVIYFTELSFVLQMLLFLIFIAICLGGVFLFVDHKKFIHLPLISGALILFLASIQLSDYYFSSQKEVSAVIVFINCLLWIFTGLRLKFLYFTISGIIGFLLLLVSFYV
jgi:hypothetical protein